MDAWRVDVSGATAVLGPQGTAELRTKERSIVAALALHHPVPATAASLAPLIWGDNLPATAIKSIHNHVSRIRTSTPGLIETGATGYQLADGIEITSSGGMASYYDLADQPQVAVARARDRVLASRRDEELVRDRVRRGASDELVAEITALVEAAPQRLVRWWWLALVQARLGRRQQALDTLRECRRGPVTLDRATRGALDRFEQAIVDDDVFLDSPAAVEPRSLGASGSAGPDPASTVTPVGIIDATGAITDVLRCIDEGSTATCLVAPAGGGKSSALRSLTTQLPPLGWHCFSTTCSPVDSNPLAPLLDLHDQRLERSGEPPSSMRSRVGEVSGDWAISILDAVTAPSNRRVLLMIDDYHHASEPTREYLARLIDRVRDGDGTVSVIAATRPGPEAELNASMVIEMPPWDLPAVEAYVHSFVAPGMWASGASRWVTERSAGNPLFVRELTVDALRRLPDEPTHTPFVPPEVASLVADGTELRFESLPEQLRDTLVAAAVLGDEFRPSDLAGLTDRISPTLALGQAHGLIEQLDTDRYRFVHQTFRQSFLDLVDAEQRVNLAHQVATIIAKSANSTDRLSDLAHFARTASSRDPEYAIETTLAQAQAAFDGLRMEEAVNIARLGMRLVDDVEGHSTRWAQVTTLAGLAAVETGDPDASELLIAGGMRAFELGQHDVVATASSRLSSQSPTTRIGGVDAATKQLFEHAYAHVTDAGSRAMVCNGGSFAAALADDPVTARQLYLEADQLSASQSDPYIRAEVLAAAYTPLNQPDDVPQRRRISEELHRLGTELDRADFTYAAYRLDFGDAVHWGHSDPRVPMAHIEHIAAELGQRSRNWSLFAFRAAVALLDGDAELAEQHAARLLTDDVTTSQQLATTTYGAHLFAIRLLQHRLSELDLLVTELQADQPSFAIWQAVRIATAAEHDPNAARRAFDQVFSGESHKIPPNFTMVAGLVVAADGARRLGDPDRMATMIRHLQPFEDRWGWFNVGTVGPVDLTLARLHAALGNTEAARVCVRRGLASTSRVGAPAYAAQLARVLADVR